MSDIIYPTLDLYLYDLRESLGQKSEEIIKNRENFQKKINTDNNSIDLNLKYHNYIIERTIAQHDQDFESEYIQLLTPPKMWFEDNSAHYSFKGYYYPVRLNDIYGLLIDCSVETQQYGSADKQTTCYPAACFAALKNQINARRNHQTATLGETWMLSGEMPSYSTKSFEEIAKECYQALVPGADWKQNLLGQGCLFGGTLFELWGYASQEQSLQAIPQDKHHVIIAFYPDEPSARKAAALNFSWLRLFCYRHKILWAYSQTQMLKQQLKKDFIPIYEGINNIQQASAKKQNFKELRSILDETQKTLSRYSINLSDFDYQVRTIDINLYNYQQRLATIEQKIEQLEPSHLILLELVVFLLQASKLSFSDKLSDYLTKARQLIILELVTYFLHQSELSFLDKFSNDVKDKYLIRVQKDYENLKPGLQLLEGLMNSIDSVRSIIEIEQAQSERTFQNTVAIWGIGLAASSFFISLSDQFPPATVLTAPAEQQKDTFQYPLIPFLIDLGVTAPWLTPVISGIFSIGMGIAFGLLAFFWIKLRQRLLR